MPIYFHLSRIQGRIQPQEAVNIRVGNACEREINLDFPQPSLDQGSESEADLSILRFRRALQMT